MSAYDELAAAVAEHGPFPMPTGEPLIVSRFDTAIEPAPEEEPVLIVGAVAEDGRPVALLLDLEARPKVARWLAPELEEAGTSPWERAVAGLNALVDADIAFWIEPDGHISGPFGDEHIVWDQSASRWRLVHDEDDDVHPPHPAPCRVPDSPDCTCPSAPRPTGLPSLTGKARHEARVAVDPAPRDPRPGAEAARRMIRDRQTAEDPHDSPLHRTYTTGRDLSEVDSYRSVPLPAAAALCATCGHNGAAHHHAGTACWADIPKRLGEAIRLCKCSAFVEVTS